MAGRGKSIVFNQTITDAKTKQL